MEEKDMRPLAYEIRDYLVNKEFYNDVVIYFNGLAISSSWEGEKDKHPGDYMDYFNFDTITISFESVFYDVMNYNVKEYGLFDKFIKSKGYYFELGNAWNLALYELQEWK